VFRRIADMGLKIEDLPAPSKFLREICYVAGGFAIPFPLWICFWVLLGAVGMLLLRRFIYRLQVPISSFSGVVMTLGFFTGFLVIGLILPFIDVVSKLSSGGGGD